MLWRAGKTFWLSSHHSVPTGAISRPKCGGQVENLTSKSYRWEVKSSQWLLEVSDRVNYEEESMKGSWTSEKCRIHFWITNAISFSSHSWATLYCNFLKQCYVIFILVLFFFLVRIFETRVLHNPLEFNVQVNLKNTMFRLQRPQVTVQ